MTMAFKSVDEVRSAVSKAVDFYNKRRPHTSIDMMKPDEARLCRGPVIMRQRVLRHIAPVVLLAAYLPMVILSSLHVHHETVDFRDDCLQCTGHFEGHHHHECDCQYCHFLNLSYFGQQIGQPAPIFPLINNCSTETAERTAILHRGASRLRAPPFHPFQSFSA